VRPVDRRAEIELVAPAPVRISGVSVGRARTRGEDPDVLTVWAAAQAGHQWVLLRSCSRLPPEAPHLFDCPVAPVQARVLRLEFGQRAGGPLAVGPVEIR
jgi:hypothetical protein